ncbi:hypothetical protein [Nostoc sp. LEGE 12450]|uniref:hypothetical protein n=1 Tax=Nostoc sp. LEGE 12450 TaxID=1828643 RepID=UPI00187F7ED9|nr:hypothetical protein [Nostoc sp. LEGE 12450]MBE8985715.1 hypothetical protein [Nostoc sp. LEGE 12450]
MRLLIGEVSLTAIAVYPSPASSLYLVQNPQPRNALKFDDLRVDAEVLCDSSLQWV